MIRHAEGPAYRCAHAGYRPAVLYARNKKGRPIKGGPNGVPVGFAASADEDGALLLFRFGSRRRLGGKLQDGGFLTFAKLGQKHGLAIRELERSRDGRAASPC